MRTSAFIVAGAIAVLIAAGCSKGSDQSSSSTTTTSTTSSVPMSSSSTTAMTASAGDPAHGKPIFSGNCSSCHGPTGIEGGIGPSLKNEKSRKNFAQTVAWIKNPLPPMPKLFPETLGEKDVADVASYVQSL